MTRRPLLPQLHTHLLAKATGPGVDAKLHGRASVEAERKGRSFLRGL